MLYSKIVIWIDLNITSDKYEAEKVVSLYKMINETKSKNNYIPTKLAYEPITDEYSGYYMQGPSASSETAHSAIAMLEGYSEMEELVKKSFLYTEDKIAQFKTNNEQ